MASSRSASRPAPRRATHVLAGSAVTLGFALAGCARPPAAAPVVPTPVVEPAAPKPASPPPPPMLTFRVDGGYRLPAAGTTAALPTAPTAYVFVSADGSMRVGRTVELDDAGPVPDLEGVIAALAAPEPAGNTPLARIDATGGFDGGRGLLGAEAGEVEGGFGFGRPTFGPDADAATTGRYGTGGQTGLGVGRTRPPLELRFERTTTVAPATSVVLVIDRATPIARVVELVEGLPAPLVFVVDGGEPAIARALALTVVADTPHITTGVAVAAVTPDIRGNQPFGELIVQVDTAATTATGAFTVGVILPDRGIIGTRVSAAPSTRIGAPTVDGQLTPAVVRRYLKRNLTRIQYCYEKQLLAKPTLGGAMTAMFVIAASGKVVSSTAVGVDGEVGRCVAHAIEAIDFPRPARGSVKVSCPLTFAATGG